MTTDIDDINMYIKNNLDLGCQAATDFLRKSGKNTQSKCAECPFVECIDDLNTADRKILKRYDAMVHVYQLQDEGYTANTIEAMAGIPTTTLQRWLVNRYKFEPRIHMLSDMVQYVDKQRSNARI